MTKNYTKILKTAELVSLAITTIGLLVTKSGINSIVLIIIGLGALATIFMLSAYIPSKSTSTEKNSFAELFAYTILPKILYLSMAISCIGILYSLLAWEGALFMLQVGVNSIFLSIIILVIVSLNKQIELKYFNAILIRATPILLVGGYLLYF